MQNDLSIFSGHERMLYERGQARSVRLYERSTNASDLKLKQRANVEFKREWLRIIKGYKFYVCEVCYSYLGSVRISNWLILEEHVFYKNLYKYVFFPFCFAYFCESATAKKTPILLNSCNRKRGASSDSLRYTSVYVLRLLASYFLFQIP